MKDLADDPTFTGSLIAILLAGLARAGLLSFQPAGWTLLVVGIGGVSIGLSAYCREQGRSWGWPALLSLARPSSTTLTALLGHLPHAIAGALILRMGW